MDDISEAIVPLSKRIGTHTTSLLKRKYRERFGQLILEGTRLIDDALHAAVKIEYCVVQNAKITAHSRLLEAISDKEIPIYRAEEKVFARMSDTLHSQGVLAVARYKDYSLNSIFTEGMDDSIIIALHEVSDPGNLGTIIRTCDWFGVRTLLISKGSIDTTNPKVIRSSMGSFFRVRAGEYHSCEQIIDLARQHGYEIYITESCTGTPIQNIERPEKLLIMFGSEARGVPEGIKNQVDNIITISGKGGAESLNLAIAHAIVLFQLTGT